MHHETHAVGRIGWLRAAILRNDVMDERLAPLRRSDAAAGTTPQEQSGIAMPSSEP